MMENNLFGQMMSRWGGDFWGPMGFGFGGALFWGPVMLVFIVWSLYWKYQAIWHAVKRDEKWWFLAFLVINTLGILEIFYLYVFSKKTLEHNEKNLPTLP